MKYFVILTTGEFEDYEISQLYGSENPINKNEWNLAMQEYSQKIQKEHDAIYARHGGRVGYGHIPAAHAEYIAYMHANHPLPAFVEKHGLVKLDHTELWTWGEP